MAKACWKCCLIFSQDEISIVNLDIYSTEAFAKYLLFIKKLSHYYPIIIYREFI